MSALVRGDNNGCPEAPHLDTAARMVLPVVRELREARSPNWYWNIPYVAVVIFAVAMLVLVWVLQVRENEVERNALRPRRAVGGTDDASAHDGDRGVPDQDGARPRGGNLDADAFQVSANQHIANNAELVNIAWVGPDETVRWTAPSTRQTGWWAIPERVADHAVLPRQGTRPAELWCGPDNQRDMAVLELYVPVFRGGRSWGRCRVYSIERMTRSLIPNWFGEKYPISFSGLDGRELSANSVCTGSTSH